MGASSSSSAQPAPAFDDIWRDNESEPLFSSRPKTQSGPSANQARSGDAGSYSLQGGGGDDDDDDDGVCCSSCSAAASKIAPCLLIPSVLVLDASYIWLLADSVLRAVAGQCSALLAHYVVVGVLLLLVSAATVIVLVRNCRGADGGQRTETFNSMRSDVGETMVWDRKGRVSRDEPKQGCCSGGLCVWLKRLCVFLLVTVLLWQAVFFALWQFGTRWTVDQRQYDDSLHVPGLAQPVTVQWEPGIAGTTGAESVLHITAQSDADLFFAQGYVSAQLRLWQMEFQRRLAAGRLAEVLGEAAIDQDKLMRTLGIMQAANASLQHLDEGTMEAVRSYTAGVNAYLGTDPQLPLEFRALRMKSPLEPWTEVDTVSWAKVMAFDLSGNLVMELRRFALSQRSVSEERIEALLPPYGYNCSTVAEPGSDPPIYCNTRSFPTVLQDAEWDASNGNPDLPPWQPPWPPAPAPREEPSKEERDPLADINARAANKLESLWSAVSGVRRGKMGASNNWVVHGDYTASGKPLLANDPHLMLGAPSVWMQMHLHGGTYEAIGAAFVGMPFVIIGHNTNAAWGVTNSGVDVQDLYIMRENAGGQYWNSSTGVYVDYEVSREVIKVRGEDDVQLDVRKSVYGPVITGALDSDTYSGAVPLSLWWTSIHADIADTTMNGFRGLGLDTTNSWESFRVVVAKIVAPPQNFVYADSGGNVGYVLAGKVPKRACKNAFCTCSAPMCHTGKEPAVSATYWRAWGGEDTFISSQQMPRSGPATGPLKPLDGYIITANNNPVPPSYLYELSSDWDSGSDGYRAKRIYDMVNLQLDRANAGRDAVKFTVEDMQRLQLDTVSGLAADFIPILNIADDSLLTARARTWKSTLLAGDAANFDTAIGSTAAPVFERWLTALARLPAIEAETGFQSWDNHAFLRSALLAGAEGRPEDPACGERGCAAFVSNALNEAVSSAPANAKWGVGAEHPAEFRHAAFGGTWLGCLFNRKAQHGGDASTVNVGSFDPKTLVQTHGPSYRQIVDFADLEGGGKVLNPMGLQGNVLARGYGAALQQWSDGGYSSMKTRNFAVGREQTLTPIQQDE